MKHSGLLFLALTVIAPVIAWGGDGVVALQTAAASCADPTNSDRYIDCGNGTVTDNDTGLVWLADANCLNTTVSWFTAMEFVAGLSDKPATSAAAAHDCGLADGSSPGEWRLPSVEEWEAMVADAVALDCVFSGFGGPSITDDSGTQCWQEGPGNSFSGVVSSFYWSASTFVVSPSNAWVVGLNFGSVSFVNKASGIFVWPVRGGQ